MNPNKANPSETRINPEEPETDMLVCPNCNMQKSDWDKSGKGFKKDGETYCCQGCAENKDCTC
jgi:hypothetical protein